MGVSEKCLRMYLEATGKDFDTEVAENFETYKEWELDNFIWQALQEVIHSGNAEAVYQALVNIPEFGPAFKEQVNSLVVLEMRETYRYLVSNWFDKNRP